MHMSGSIVTFLTRYMKLAFGLTVNAGAVTGWQRTLKRKIGTFPCPVCYKTFRRNHIMKVHARNLHGEDRGPFQCVFCAQWSKNAESMRKHIANHHPNSSVSTSS